jgi:hypothetical protein
MRSRARLAVSPICEASSIRQGDGKRFQKKAMKTTKSNEASAPANVQKSFSVSKTGNDARPAEQKQKDFIRHCENRKLPTESILDYLRRRLPKQYELAEVVGNWIWLESPAKGGIAATLWHVGFHWNKRRGVWQHPCGIFDPLGSHPSDPRAKYRSYFAASKTA